MLLARIVVMVSFSFLNTHISVAPADLGFVDNSMYIYNPRTGDRRHQVTVLHAAFINAPDPGLAFVLVHLVLPDAIARTNGEMVKVLTLNSAVGFTSYLA
jgi:hypothetical protein